MAAINSSTLSGKAIVSADSSLKNFVIRLDGETGLSFEAVVRNGAPAIEARVAPASELPQPNEAVCSVDWSWICDSRIENIAQSEQVVQLQLAPAGPLKISVGIWQASPFLSFQPYKAPGK